MKETTPIFKVKMALNGDTRRKVEKLIKEIDKCTKKLVPLKHKLAKVLNKQKRPKLSK